MEKKINCAFCNKEFSMNTARHKYCSTPCKEKSYRVKHGYKPREFYDEESHRLLAIHGNVYTTTEWRELYSLKILPDGCKASPSTVAGDKTWKEFIKADTRPLKEIMEIVGKNDKHHYDFQTHLDFARNSGIEGKTEWEEIASNGWLPDGIYHNPSDAFRDPDAREKKNNKRKRHYSGSNFQGYTSKEKRKVWRAANYRRKRELAMSIKYGENRDAT